jgi:hypothetical protein
MTNRKEKNTFTTMIFNIIKVTITVLGQKNLRHQKFLHVRVHDGIYLLICDSALNLTLRACWAEPA